MASGKDIKAGGAYVEIGAKDKSLVDKLRAAEARVKAFGLGIMQVGARVAAAGIAFVTPFLLLANSFAEAGARLEQISARTGVAVESLSALEYVAKASGNSLDQVADALKGTNQFLQAAAAGGDDTRQVMRELGVTLDQLNSATPEERFRVLADRISRIPDPTRRAAAAMKVFGEAGLQLLPMLNQGADGFARLEEQARELGLVMSGPDAQAATQLRAAIQTLWQLVSRLGQVIGASVTPILMDFLTVITGLLGGVVRWINQNRELVAMIFRIGVGVVVAGAAIAALGAVIYLGGIGIGIFTTALSIASGAVTAFKVVVTILYSVLGLLPLALIAIAAAFLYYSGVGRQAFNDVTSGFSQLYTTATETWAGIVSAISAGDLELAFRVAVAGLRLIWAQTVAWLQTKWLEYTTGTSDTFGQASTDIAKMAVSTFYGLGDLAVTVAATITQGFVNAVASIRQAWAGLLSFVEGLWARVVALISGGDVQQALDDVAARARATQAQIEADRQGQTVALEMVVQEARRGIASQRDPLLGQLDQMQNEANSRSQAEQARRRRTINAPVADAQREFDAATLEAWIAGEQAAIQRAVAANNQTDPRPELGKSSTTGTFNAAVVSSLGGNGPAERTATATEQTAANTRRILDEARDGGFAWA